MIKNTGLIQAKDFKVGLYTGSDIINPSPDLSPNCMDVRWYFDKAIGKRLGSSTSNTVSLTSGGGVAGFIVGNALTTGLISYWKLDEASGNRSDSFGRNTMFDKNNVGLITGIRNGAALFVSTNSNQLTALNTASLVTGNIPFSLAGWFYLNSTSGTAESTIISKRDPEIDIATTMLLHMDGANGGTTFTDSSSFGNVVTPNGGAVTSTAQIKFGTASASLTGGGYLSVPIGAIFDFEQAAFTFDCWVRFNTLPTQYIWAFASDNTYLLWNSAIGQLIFNIEGTGGPVSAGWAPAIDTWYHIATVRDNSGNCYLFVDGVQIGSTGSNSSTANASSELQIGAYGATSTMDGFVDEFRVSKGVARWTSNFTPPTRAYGVQDYEYWLYVNTNNQLTFRVSSSGAIFNGQVSSAGNINLNQWYNYVAFHQTAGGSTAAHIGLSVNQNVTTAGYTSGVRAGSAPVVLGAISDGLSGFATAFYDGRQDEVGFWKRALVATDFANIYAGGSGNTYTSSIESNSWYSFDFGASTTRWYTISAGTGIFASSNLGTTFVTVATSRTANYQYLDRSKNVLIATSDSYDPTLYWAGSATTFFATVAPNSAPNAKFSINYQGFLILLNYMNSNSVVSNRGFTYADENIQLSSTWPDRFDLPSSADDEITGPFILNKFLYVSTKFRIFRLNYTGGNPDWQYIQVKNFGFVPRTVKVFTLKQGQVAVGLDWSRRLRAFDGYDDQIISDNVENDNGYCQFSMQNISLAGSGLIVSNAEFDQNLQEYRLNVAIGAMSTQTTHAIVLNSRTLSMYPFANQPYNTMTMAESAGRSFLMAVDRSGYAHILNSGNLDAGVTPINENYDSPLLFNKAPSEVTKNKQLNLFFSRDSCGTIYYQEAFDFSTVFGPMKTLKNQAGQAELLGTESALQLVRTVDLPSVQNIYQWRIASSANSANPWTLTHFDLLNTGLGYGRGA